MPKLKQTAREKGDKERQTGCCRQRDVGDRSIGDSKDMSAE